MKRLLILFAVLIGGCADPKREAPYTTAQIPIEKAGGFTCDAKPVAYAKGKKATAELAGKLMKEAGATILRWIPPRSAVTMDYSSSRINIVYDDAYIITDVTCG